jgi:hypothetical protein
MRAVERGRLRAALASGAWRASPPPVALSDSALGGIAPLLLWSGEGSLGWSRIRETAASRTEQADELHQAYRLNLLFAGACERDLVQVLARLRAGGIEPLLGKGWAAARLYADRGVRPCGDIDLYVAAESHATARTLLAESQPVDLHLGFAELDDRSPDEMRRRSQTAEVLGSVVRVFGPEDHLRLLALHMLRHGAWRPLWMCDVAAALESRGADLDWDYLMEGDPHRTEWVACALGLARELLGAELAGAPPSVLRRLPRWIIPAVLRQWGRGGPAHGNRAPMADEIHHPRRLLTALRLRWPNPIEATLLLHAGPNDLPRLPFQIGACAVRAARFLSRGRRSPLVTSQRATRS